MIVAPFMAKVYQLKQLIDLFSVILPNTMQVSHRGLHTLRMDQMRKERNKRLVSTQRVTASTQRVTASTQRVTASTQRVTASTRYQKTKLSETLERKKRLRCRSKALRMERQDVQIETFESLDRVNDEYVLITDGTTVESVAQNLYVSDDDSQSDSDSDSDSDDVQHRIDKAYNTRRYHTGFYNGYIQGYQTGVRDSDQYNDRCSHEDCNDCPIAYLISYPDNCLEPYYVGYRDGYPKGYDQGYGVALLCD